jgi:inner membrane protein
MSELKNTIKNRGVQNTLKIGLIAILAIFLLIPKVMILELIAERKSLSQDVESEISMDWSGPQIFQGPVLVIPYKVKKHHIGQKTEILPEEQQNLIVFPKSVKIDGDLSTSSKKRSLYEVRLYKTVLKASGVFQIPDAQELNIAEDQLLLNESYVVLGLNYLKGIEDKVNFKWNSEEVLLKPGVKELSFNQNISENSQNSVRGNVLQSESGKSGLNGKVTVTDIKNEIPFTFEMKFKGSKSLYFIPYGEENDVSLKSPFADPVFTGNFLPDHQTGKNGFKANWRILEYNKILPAYQSDNNFIDGSKDMYGLEIKNIVDHYTQINRAAKYMFLVVALMFLTFFISEIIYNQKIHIFQYALVGFAIALFFVLLLSISEFLGFNISYLIAAASIIILNTLYAKSVFTHRNSVFMLAGLNVLLFSYIYIIIQLEKSSLLVGSIGLFVILATTMYVTRKVKWNEE